MRYRPSGLGTTLFFRGFRGENVEAFALPARGEGKGWGFALCKGRAAPPLLKRSPHRVRGRVHRLEAFHRPTVERDYGPAETAGNRDLAQRAPAVTDRDHALRGGDDDDVAGLAHPGGQR